MQTPLVQFSSLKMIEVLKHSDDSEIKPRGITNIGNTCFANVTLQALSSLLTFKNHIRTVKENIGTQSDELVIGPLSRIMDYICASKDIIDYKYEDIKTIIKKCNLIYGEQQDAHEIFQNILSQLEDITKKKHLSNLFQGVYKELTCKQDKGGTKRKNSIFESHNPFYGLVGSELKKVDSELKNVGSDPKHQFQSFNNLSLAIPSNRSTSLEECLHEYMNTETVKWKDVGDSAVQDYKKKIIYTCGT